MAFNYTTKLNLPKPPDGDTGWGDAGRGVVDALEDVGDLFSFPVVPRFDPVAGQVFFDGWAPPEDISITAVLVSSQDQAPAGGNLQGDITVNGSAQSKAFALNSGANKQTTSYGTILDVDAGDEVGLKWTSIPSTSGRPDNVVILYRKRAIATIT